MTHAPRMYALDEHGAHIEAWLGEYREGSEFAAWPGVPAVLDITESTQIGDRLVLLDVDTLAVTRVDRAELDGKWQCHFSALELRGHLECKVADCRRFRLRYDSKAMARALRRLAAAGAPSSWNLSLTRPHPEHPLEEHDFVRSAGREAGATGAADRRRGSGGFDSHGREPVTRKGRNCTAGSCRRSTSSPPAPASQAERSLALWPELREQLS